MNRMTRFAFFVAMILFGTAASGGVRAEEIDDGPCGGTIQPLCAVRSIKKCTAWKACNQFTWCCDSWDVREVRDYFRPKDSDAWDGGWEDGGDIGDGGYEHYEN